MRSLTWKAGYKNIRNSEARSLILLLLTQKFGTLPDRSSEEINNLNLEQMESLAVSLLSFSTIADLEHWLQAH